MAKRTGPDAAGPVPTGWYRSRSVRSSPCFDETSRQLTLGRCVTLSSSRACPRTGGTLSGAPSTSETGLSANSNFMILSSRTTGVETCGGDLRAPHCTWTSRTRCGGWWTSSLRYPDARPRSVRLVLDNLKSLPPAYGFRSTEAFEPCEARRIAQQHIEFHLHGPEAHGQLAEHG